MKINYQVTANATLEVDVKNVTQAFEFFAYCDSLFAVPKCGNCGAGKEHLHLRHRSTSEGFNYYSVECDQCRYELKFGQAKSGHLFGKGWHEPYQGGKAKDETQDDREPVGAASGSDDVPF